MSDQISQVKAQAKKDAALFAEEFPGETAIRGDWDSAAFEFLPARLRTAAAWEVYRATLHEEVRLLATAVSP